MSAIINIQIGPSIKPTKNQTKADLFFLLAIAAQPKAQASQTITTPIIIATSIFPLPLYASQPFAVLGAW